MTDERTNGADHSDQPAPEVAEVLLLPAQPMSPIEHARKLCALALTMLAERRVGPAMGVLRAQQKVLWLGSGTFDTESESPSAFGD